MANAENINHFGSIRLRVKGSGNLQLTLYSIDNVKSQSIPAIGMQENTNIQPTRLCNFVQQRAALEVKTTAIDEQFKIDRIIIFSKIIFTSYPG
jgi:hypothetical protein